MATIDVRREKTPEAMERSRPVRAKAWSMVEEALNSLVLEM
jgi:hypothetical protein